MQSAPEDRREAPPRPQFSLHAVASGVNERSDSAEKVIARMGNLGRLEWSAFAQWAGPDKDRAQVAMLEAHQKALAECGIEYDANSLIEHARNKVVPI